MPRLLAVLGLGLLVLPLPRAQAQSQPADPASDTTTTDPVGRLVYFEGNVTVKSNGEWTPARIDQSLRPSDRLATGPSAQADIKWASGGQSTLGPADTQRVGRLYTRAQAQAPDQAASLLDRFRELFTEQTKATDDPAALRRGAGTPFEQATMLYRRNQFQNARPLFEKVLASDASTINSSKAALARFALAHCHLEAGNRKTARTHLQSLVDRHPASKPARLARSLLDQL